jgi:hypothetical protein
MITKSKREIALLSILALLLTLGAGCSSNAKSAASDITVSSNSNTNTADVNAAPAPDKSSASNTTASPDTNNNSADNSSQEDSQKALLANMIQLAKQGKIINSEFGVKTTVIDTVEKKLGKPDKVDWVPEAKGNYATFSKYNVAFGFNKGMQIFEARSFDSRLRNLSLSMVKKVYGTPAYDVKANGEEIIGYTAGQEYKILLVFPSPSNDRKDPYMSHYSVLYPRGTVNSMANDPGRQW